MHAGADLEFYFKKGGNFSHAIRRLLAFKGNLVQYVRLDWHLTPGKCDEVHDCDTSCSGLHTLWLLTSNVTPCVMFVRVPSLSYTVALTS